MIAFMRGFLGNALKDNSHLQRGFLTGILRIAKESIFSGLNNLLVCSVTHPAYSHYFGFTQDEVNQLLHKANLLHYGSDIQNWYNGYQFNHVKIYKHYMAEFQQHGVMHVLQLGLAFAGKAFEVLSSEA